jgi:hypothetical protein
MTEDEKILDDLKTKSRDTSLKRKRTQAPEASQSRSDDKPFNRALAVHQVWGPTTKAPSATKAASIVVATTSSAIVKNI